MAFLDSNRHMYFENRTGASDHKYFSCGHGITNMVIYTDRGLASREMHGVNEKCKSL